MNPVIKTAFGALVVSFLATPALTQEQAGEAPAPPEPVCESMDEFNDFDFWLGEWDVYSNDEKRQLQGSNSITKHHGNCLIMENWTSTQGRTGRSMNYYDPVEGQWRQLWVAGSYSIDYTGGLSEAGSMILNGKINYYQTGKSHAFRGTWTPNADGSVRQFFEQKNSENGQWTVWFDGIYIKKGSK